MKKRLAAEWEPAVGVMVGYPIALPKALIQKLAHDTTVYLLCGSEDAVEDAKALMTKWGIDPEAERYVIVPKGDDSTWPRDWGPHPLFDERGNFALLGPRYKYSTPFCGAEHQPTLYCPPWGEEKTPLAQFEGNTADDGTAGAVASQLGVPFVKAPFAFTGGNVLNDGINTILSTEVLLAENEFEGLERSDYYQLVADITGMANYTVLSDYESFSLNHVDCFLKILDDRRLLVERPPADSELFPIYENIVNNELSKARNSHGEPWEIIRIDADYVRPYEGIDAGTTETGEGIAAYVNSLILNKCVYVPMYGIATDESALETWRRAMPGYDVQGFTYEIADETDSYNPDGLYGVCGWDPGDVLHCRTRAVWDPQMLYVRADGPVAPAEAGKPTTVDVVISAYSRTPIVDSETKLYWRVAGTETWNEAPLVAGPTHETYVAEVPAQETGTTVEYYAVAADGSGRRECFPRVAPSQYRSFEVR